MNEEKMKKGILIIIMVFIGLFIIGRVTGCVSKAIRVSAETKERQKVEEEARIERDAQLKEQARQDSLQLVFENNFLDELPTSWEKAYHSIEFSLTRDEVELSLDYALQNEWFRKAIEEKYGNRMLALIDKSTHTPGVETTSGHYEDHEGGFLYQFGIITMHSSEDPGFCSYRETLLIESNEIIIIRVGNKGSSTGIQVVLNYGGNEYDLRARKFYTGKWEYLTKTDVWRVEVNRSHRGSGENFFFSHDGKLPFVLVRGASIAYDFNTNRTQLFQLQGLDRRGNVTTGSFNIWSELPYKAENNGWFETNRGPYHEFSSGNWESLLEYLWKDLKDCPEILFTLYPEGESGRPAGWFTMTPDNLAAVGGIRLNHELSRRGISFLDYLYNKYGV